ncbi:CHASE domain-containing protein [Thalassospira sp.]|uniref:CHASE domain-containing protein n=1 Tax=Thalassospira sp. TaxID=1912094 RepID=UPI002638EBA9|nr:CHASE domain-containing protein [Thalassospira sp.]MCH2277166.1 CHASE domain-containing protein [Thalassospira sp.]
MRLGPVHIIRFAAITLTYFVFGYAGLQFPFYGSSVTLIWAPSGIALGTLVAWGWRYFPAVFLGALLVNLTTSAPPETAILIATGNTLAATLSSLLIVRFCSKTPLLSARGIFGLIAIGGIGGPALAALCGTLSLSLTVIGNFDQFTTIWHGWWLGDLVGALVIGPLVLRLIHQKWRANGLAYYAELAFVCVATIIVSSAVQTTPLIAKPEYLFIFVSLPFVLWGAIRFGLLGAALVNALIVIDIVVFAAMGESTFLNINMNVGLANLYSYVIVVTIGTLLLGAGIEKINIVTSRTRDGRISNDIHRLRRNLALIVGLLGFSISGLAAWYTFGQINEATDAQTEQYRRAFEASLREELGRATDSLIAVRTLFDVHGDVSFHTFNAMIGPWVERRAGVGALEWVPYIEGRARALIEENASLRGVENFEIRSLVDGQMQPAPERDAYFPVFYIFPRSGNENVIGFDLSSEEIRNRALQTAIRTGNITLTEPVKLVQSSSSEVTALAFLNVPNRRNPGAAPLGLAVGVLRLTNMITRAARIARLPSDFEIHLADLDAPAGHQLIYSNRRPDYAMSHIADEITAGYNPKVSTFTFGFRDWTIVLHGPGARLNGLLYWQPWAIFVFGATISILLMVYLRSLTRTERRIVDLVYQRTLELENARQEAENAMNQAQQADRAKSEFIAHMSHEFRSPMTSILGYAQLARDGIDKHEPSETVRNYLSTINGAGRHVLSLIGDVLDLSKIEAGKLVLEEVPTDIHAICEEVVSMMMVPARNQDNRLHLEIPADMPRWVIGDPVRIKQVLTNFVSNAIKFSRSGDIHVIATPQEIANGRMAFRIAVRDEGIGIPADKLRSIFEAFTQVDTSTTRRFGGTGLGLAICQKMILAMGGTIDVKSTEGTGSTFWFDLNLPLADAPEARSDAEDDSQLGLADPDKPRVLGRKLLLVEDIQINRILAQKLLEQQGHEISVAANGQEALNLLQEQDFDAVLMDVHMPVMDGIEATRQIRKFADPVKATIPVLALTADTSNDNLAEFREAGMDAHCTKPLDIKAINHELARLDYRMLSERKQQLTGTGE